MQSLLRVSNQSRQQRGQRHQVIIICVTRYGAESVVIDGYDYDYCCAFDVFEPEGTRDRQIRLNLPENCQRS